MANVNPPQPAPQLGPQPDFARLTQGFQQATTGFQQATTGLQQTATELGNFANLPPFAQGNALIQQMLQLQQNVQQQTHQQQQFQQQMQQQMQQMQQQIADVDNNIHAFRNEIRTTRQATEYNSIARLENSAARRSNHSLTVFRDHMTNTDIQGFPATPAQLENMTGVELDPVLASLDLPVHGTAITKRQRLSVHIGLTQIR